MIMIVRRGDDMRVLPDIAMDLLDQIPTDCHPIKDQEVRPYVTPGLKQLALPQAQDFLISPYMTRIQTR